MRLRPLRSWGLCLALALFLPSLLSAQGVVVETVAQASAPEKAGAREGDVFRAWTRPANPPANPEPASGMLESPFDWNWMEIEQAPRGIVELRGERQGQPLVLQVPIGLWEAQVRPVLLAEFEDLYRRGKELVDQEKVEEGVIWWQQVAERAGNRGDWRLGAWIWLRIGLAWDRTSGFKQAEAAYQTALQESRDALSRIGVLVALAKSYENRQRLEQAEAAYRSALELQEATWGESLLTARSLDRLGWISRLQGKPAMARQLLESALAIRERLAPGSLEISISFNGLGLVALDRGDLETAEKYCNEALATRERLAPESRFLASTLNNLGSVASARGDLEAAEGYYRRSLSICEKLPDQALMVADALGNLGKLALRRGDLVPAEGYLQRSLQLRHQWAPRSLGVADSLNSLGILDLYSGDLKSAEDHLQNSLAIYERVAPESLDMALSLMNLGMVTFLRGDLASAEKYYHRSLSIREREVPRSCDLADSLTHLGNLTLERGELGAAQELLERALLIYEKSAPASIEMAVALQHLSSIAWRTGHGESAAQLAHRALESLEAQIDHLGGSLEIEGQFRARQGDVYRDALRIELELNRPQEAFRLLERFRARAFLALLAERDLTFAEDLTPELDRKRRRLAVLYDRNQLRLAELDPEKEGKTIEALQREQAELRRRREEIAAEIRRIAPRLAALQNPQALTFEQVREALDPGTVMLSYSAGKEQTHLFIVTPGRELHVETLKVGRQTLEKDVDRFRQLIDQTRAGSALGAQGLDWFSRRLYNLLVEPAEPWIAAADRIVLVPDGPLHLLPFAALMRPDRTYLVEWKPLSTVLSGTVFAELKKQRRGPGAMTEPSSQQRVAFGDPWFPPRLAEGLPEDIGEARLRSISERSQLSWKRLPQSRREVEEIAALFPADRRRTYLDREASEERAKGIGKDARIVHFATHGFVDDRSPFDSGLVLSIPEELTEGRDNGLLQVWEIFESVRLDADLVVLSACETGIGEIRGGEGIIGLTRAFQYAGARSVLASLWRVEDEATAELMQRFYRHLRAGKAKDEALRAAQLELIRRPLRVPDGRGGWIERNAAAPYFWAALQLFGDGR